jgi:hypothetical protein
VVLVGGRCRERRHEVGNKRRGNFLREGTRWLELWIHRAYLKSGPNSIVFFENLLPLPLPLYFGMSCNNSIWIDSLGNAI